MRSEKRRSGASARMVAGIVIGAGILAILVWNGMPLGTMADSRPGGETAGSNVAEASVGKNGVKPWVPGDNTGKNHPEPPAAVESGELPAPAVPTPILDSWLAANMDKGDEEFTAGLLAFAEDEKQPPEERAAALNHALNMLPDKDYAMLGPLLEARGRQQG